MRNAKEQILKQYLFMGLFVVLVRVAFGYFFGNFSIDSARLALFDGLKLAGWVLAFGFLNMLVDFRKAVKRVPAKLGSLATALNIALTLVPEMAQNVLRVRRASRLRAHRRGIHFVRSVVVPVVSNAIDQSITLADSLEARGYGQAISNSPESLVLADVTFGYSRGKVALSDVSLTIPRGQFVLISGKTGSGKSTLLKLLQARNSGTAFVDQFPRQGFVADTVFDELSFSLVQAGKPKEQVVTRVNEISKQFELESFLNLDPKVLSSGWQQRVAIAASLAGGAKFLLLDEPLSSLDEAATNQVLGALQILKREGVTCVIAEHRIEKLLSLSDVCYQVVDGTLSKRNPAITKLKPRKSQNGKVTALVGPNGSGKTTHLNKIATKGGVLVPQPASDLLFLNSVSEELAQSDLDAKKPEGFTKELLSRFNLGIDFTQNPRDLSEGQKLALALSVQLAKDTELLLLDEPTLGFDTPSKQALIDTIHELSSGDLEILIATHDLEFADAITDKNISITEVNAYVA